MPEPAEKFFLTLIGKFNAEDIRDCIQRGEDLARIVSEEFPDFLTQFKEMARVYRDQHSKQYSDYRNLDRMTAAKKFVDWLKGPRPDLAYEIAAYESHPSAMRAGFQPVGATATAAQQQHERKHEGYEWTANNLRSLEELLL